MIELFGEHLPAKVDRDYEERLVLLRSLADTARLRKHLMTR
jgi:hypothetical protein